MSESGTAEGERTHITDITDLYESGSIASFYHNLDTLALACLVIIHSWPYLAEKNPGIVLGQEKNYRDFWNGLIRFKIHLFNNLKRGEFTFNEEEKEDLKGWFEAINEVNGCFVVRKNPDKEKLAGLREKSKKMISAVLWHVDKSVAASFHQLNMDTLLSVVEHVQDMGIIDFKTGEEIFREVNIDVLSMMSKNST